MKIIAILIIFFFGCYNNDTIKGREKTNSIDTILTKNNDNLQEADSLLLKTLKGKKLNIFINKPVNEFLKDSILSSYKEYVFIDNKPGRLTGILFSYSRRITIMVELPNDFKYSQPFNKYNNWDFNLVKQENIRDIKLRLDDIEVSQ